MARPIDLTPDEWAKLHLALAAFCAAKAGELLNSTDPTANRVALVWLQLARLPRGWIGEVLEVMSAAEPAATRRIVGEVLSL